MEEVCVNMGERTTLVSNKNEQKKKTPLTRISNGARSPSCVPSRGSSLNEPFTKSCRDNTSCKQREEPAGTSRRSACAGIKTSVSVNDKSVRHRAIVML